MKFLILLFLLFGFSVQAQENANQKDTFDDGANAFVAGNYEEAERILKLHAKEQPSAEYLLRLIDALKKKNKIAGATYDVFVERLNKGDTSNFDKLGIIPRYKGEITGISGTMYVNSLIGNARKGDVNAIYNLALLHQEGIGVPRNYKQAADYFKIAADKGHLNALNSIGLYTRFGIGTKKDQAKAEEYFKQAALKNNPFALYNLSLLYLDKKDFVQAYITAEIGQNHLDPKTEQKIINRYLNIRKRAVEKLSVLQKAYLEKFIPFWLSPIATQKDLNGRIYPKKLPLPPAEMIQEIKFMFPLKRDDFDGKYKTFYPLMPSWVPFDIEQPTNPDLQGRTLPYPAPESDEAIKALYYRVANPSTIHLTLTKPNSGMPVMVGDVFEIIVYSKLYENERTKKGAHMYIDNTAYKIELESDGSIVTDNKPVLTALSIETRNQETWLSQAFEAVRPGVSYIRFIPQPTPDGTQGFAHTLVVRVSEGKLPK